MIRSAPRRASTVFATFAILFQALAFGWHQHELPFASRGSPVVAAAATGSETPASVDRDCPICSAIAHHGAVPVDLFAPVRPDSRALRELPPVAVGDRRVPYLLFHSRAPPRV